MNNETAGLKTEIKDLRDELKAEDSQINIFMQKEGEIKGKDEVIASLNSNIENFKQQLDALRDNHNIENPL